MKRPAILLGISLVAGIVLGVTFNWGVILIGSIFYLFLLVAMSKTDNFKWLLMCLLFIFFGFSHILLINNQIREFSDQFDNENHLVLVINSIARYEESAMLTCRVKAVDNKSLSIFRTINIKLSTKNDAGYNIGDVIEMSGTLKEISKPTNKGQFNSYYYYFARRIYFSTYSDQISRVRGSRWNLNRWITAIRDALERRIDVVYSGAEKEIIKTMLLGLKSGLDNTTKDYYKVAGISHLLAISGLHVSILVMGLLSLLSIFIKKTKRKTLIAIAILWLYCMMTGFSISTFRATLMITIMLSSKLVYRKYDSTSAMFISLIIILSISPYQIFDVGFLLSFGAVFGIIFISPHLNEKLNRGNNGVISLLIATFSASLSTYPIIAYFFYQIPLYALIVNLFVLPFMSLVLYSSILAIFVSIISQSLGVLISSVGVFILRYINVVCEVVTTLPYNLITIGQPRLIIILLYYIIIILWLWREKQTVGNIIEVLTWSGLLLSIIIISIYNDHNLHITCLDVGQGDCAVIEYQNQVLIIDSGGDIKSQSESNKGKSVLLPFLYSKGYDKIDGVFISHSDFDHIYGIIEIIDLVKIDFIVLPYPYKNESDELANRLIESATEKGIAIYYFKEGDSYYKEGLRLYCIYPNITDTTFENNNEKSNVFRLDFYDFSMLFTGDIEIESEERIVKRQIDIDVDVLKVPHHGSNTSSTEAFINKTDPRLAIFSYGEHNFFGHPSYEVLMRYKGYNVDEAHIAKEGAVEISVNQSRFTVSYYYSNRREVYPCRN